LEKTPDFLQEAKRIKDDLIIIRRGIHKNPELGNEERRTSRFIAKSLERLGLDVKMGRNEIGVIGSLNVNDGGAVVCLRADMDAIAITENTGVSYESRIPGVMHACGHDIHCAAVMGAAKILCGFKNQLQGGVRFIFQPAEEIDLGAKAMLEQGVLADPKPIGIFGLHVWPDLILGEVGIQPGAVMASIDNFDVTFKGSSAHGAEPHLGRDALLAASMSIVALQQVIARSVDPYNPAVITVGKMRSGTARNIIADSASFSGTVRTLDAGVRRAIRDRVYETILGCANACGVTAFIDYKQELPVLVNSGTLADMAIRAAKDTLGDSCIKKTKPSMAGDDFALYAERIPGCYIFIGVSTPEQKASPLHSPEFNVDERVIPMAAALLANVCWHMLR
jgi:amidohydrolase